jgi:hypothetical protein
MALKSLEDELTEILSKEIAEEIDSAILAKLYCNDGWTKVPFLYKNSSQAIDVNEWLTNTCKNKWIRLGSNYLFEDIKEAEWFILRWV